MGKRSGGDIWKKYIFGYLPRIKYSEGIYRLDS